MCVCYPFLERFLKKVKNRPRTQMCDFLKLLEIYLQIKLEKNNLSSRSQYAKSCLTVICVSKSICQSQNNRHSMILSIRRSKTGKANLWLIEVREQRKQIWGKRILTSRSVRESSRCTSDYMDVYIYKHLLSCTLKVCALYCM